MPTGKKSRKSESALAFNHAMIYVRNVDRALGFYERLLGFKLIEAAPGCYARLKAPAGRAAIALHQFAPAQECPSSDAIRLYFEVKQLDAICERLAAAGVRISQMPKRMPWGRDHAYLNDPDGHEVSLYWAGAKRFRKSTWDHPVERTSRRVPVSKFGKSSTSK